MSKPLVIVESPTKVRTLKKYLGKDYNVEATVGHVMDLPQKDLGIDTQHGFSPTYQVIPGKQKVVACLKKAAGSAMEIYLAPDPDREGEAIAWHTSEILKKKGRTFHRVLFHELTKNAILKAMSAPQELDKSKFDAQQVRRILDRLVGYQVSPLLWRKVKGGLSAGRVQSVAVRIICERERAIQAFEPQEYWSFTAALEKGGPPKFLARLAKKNGKKLTIENQETAEAVEKDLADVSWAVDQVVKKTVKKNPPPPFTTSKMQQDAIRRLRFTAKKAMAVAQQLYEGVDLGPGELEGLITYMRTDSTRIADEAALEALDHVEKTFGREYRPDKPRQYRNTKKVQDAHEAIRPTSVANTPEAMAPFLSADQLALYTLIWQRFVASQMATALVDQTSVTVSAGLYQFAASGSTLKFPGYLALTKEEEDPQKSVDLLPNLEKGDALNCLDLEKKQHFTQPPPRFSEGTLVKELEENGIGRPSTYAAILSTIRVKNYVELLKGYFRPSELGFIVNDLLTSTFGDVFDVDFTAQMEDRLDQVEAAQINPGDVLESFYQSFKKDLDQAEERMVSAKGVGLVTPLSCPTCQKPLHIKVGKNGPFLACSGYPDCRFTRNYIRDEKGGLVMEEVEEAQPTDEVCEKCGLPMMLKKGKFGPFYACSGYPECKNTRSANGGTSRATGVKCPEEGCPGELVEKRSKRGKIFFGCNRYPDCKYATWDQPVPKACPACAGPFLVEKTSKKTGPYLVCPAQDCGYRENKEG
ncbi:MAG: type I DNA topoisomerase [Proteobacteria bacterium]|nr:type I DNA topoisomerase [Pseudomonadota bacterium]